MGAEIPCQFNQKRGLTICAKGDNARNQSGGEIEIPVWSLLLIVGG